MFRPQVVATVLVALFVIGMIVSAVSPWQIPGPESRGIHSFSGRISGYRALYDLLEAFKVPTRRFLDVPGSLFEGERRVLLLEPNVELLEREKGYLARLGEWLRAGGQVVVVARELEYLGADDYDYDEDAENEGGDAGDEEMQGEDPSSEDVTEAQDSSDGETAEAEAATEAEDTAGEDETESEEEGFESREDRYEQVLGADEFLKQLGLSDIWVEPQSWYESEEDASLSDVVVESFRKVEPPNTQFDAKVSGSFSKLEGAVARLQLPAVYSWFEGDGIEKAVGRIDIVDEDGEGYPVVLEFQTEKGQVVLVSEPTLLNNAGLSLADNAVAAFAVAAGEGTREVVLDEYYHGSLTGLSPVALFAVYPYGVVGFSVLIAALLWAWSHGVRFGIPAPHAEESRRSILEYVDAMSRLFRRGRKDGFVLRTNRQGVIDEWRASLHLAYGTAEALVLRRLGQVDPAAHGRLTAVLRDVDAELAQGEWIAAGRLMELQERLETCRTSKNRSLTRRSAPGTASLSSTTAPSGK